MEEIKYDNDRERNANCPKQYAAHDETSIASGIVSGNRNTMEIMHGSSMADRITLQCPARHTFTYTRGADAPCSCETSAIGDAKLARLIRLQLHTHAGEERRPRCLIPIHRLETRIEQVAAVGV